MYITFYSSAACS